MATFARMCLYIAQLFTAPQAHWLAGLVAKLMYKLNVDAAQVTRINLTVCFPDWKQAEIEAATLDSLKHMALLMFEMAQMSHWSEARLLGQIQEVHGEDLLSEAHQSEHGVLLLVPHYGNWELLCAFLGVNYSVAALYDPPKIKSLEPVVRDARQKYQGQMFPIDTAGMRGMLRVLKSGELVAILPDQVPERDAGVYANFFGQPALSMSLTHRLIVKNRPKVLFGSVQRIYSEKEGWGYRLTFEAPAEQVYAGDAEESLTAINGTLENIIKRDVGQYQWEYKRFKRPPDSLHSNIYRRQ